MGAISCFFPIALSAASGMRRIDGILIRVGRSFRANAWQMATKIYLPAMRHPLINGVRLGLGVALIGALLAETRLSSSGIGFLIITPLALLVARQRVYWPLIPAVILGAVGVAILAGGVALQVVQDVGMFWPVILIAAGVYVLWRAGFRRPTKDTGSGHTASD